MNRHQQGLAQRRRELVERSATQRGALDRLVSSVRRHPLVTGLVGARKLFAMTTRLLTLYMLFRRWAQSR